MSGWHHTNANWKPKKCGVCAADFIPKSGAHKFCSESCKGKWQYISGRVTTESQYKLISGNWERYISRLLARSERRAVLTREEVMELLKAQEYRCALSGVPLTCTLEKGTRAPANASLDRIRAGGPYTIDNLQLVCRVLNSWRSDTPLDEFVDWCHKVAEHGGRYGKK